jgi:hypothetical protein
LICVYHYCSYDAAEDNEVSFREGDRITEIDFVGDDWWAGHDQYGNVGLFPGVCFLRYLQILGYGADMMVNL